MNKLISLIAFTLLFSLAAFAQEKTQEITPDVEDLELGVDSSISTDSSVVKFIYGKQIDWERLSHNFGRIYTFDKVETSFSFTNVSTAPIIILDVKTTCGCTAPVYTQEPIMPGETGDIKINFNSWTPGMMTKSISVFTNASDYPTKLFIMANVLDSELLDDKGESKSEIPQPEPEDDGEEN